MNRDDYLEHPLPSSDDAEQVCLGAVILDNEVMSQVNDALVPSDFYSPVRKLIYNAMQVLYSEGGVIDPVTIGETIKHIAGPDALLSMGGASTIANLAMGLPHFKDVEEYVKIVRQTSVSRQTIRLCNAVTRDLLADDGDAMEILSKLESRVLKLNGIANGDNKDVPLGFTSVKDIVPSVREQFERYHRGEVSGVQTGMAPLDDLLDGGGLQPKATYVIGGSEKSGKTSLALEWVRHITVSQGLCVPIVTLEMSKETLTKRLYSMHTGIPYYMFRPGFYDSATDNSYTRAIQGLENFGQYPFRIADSLYTIAQIKRFCTRLVELGHSGREPKVGAIMLDYLQIIRTDSRTANREREVTEISREIKLIASELDVPVIVLSNLNRVGLSEGQEPDVHNLRDSGSIGFDAEAVMFLHNPALIPGKPYEPRPITDINLILSRQRNGPTGRIPLKFIGAYMSFMTEREFLKHFGDTQETPTAKGVLTERDKIMENQWQDDDEDYS